MRNLVLVESPTKANTISKFLGKNYKVIATKGHVRDLPKSSLGVDVDHDFVPEYITLPAKEALITEIRKELNKSDTLILAPDPDREGEAIAWHMGIALGVINKKLVKNKKYAKLDIKRIVFHEITKEAILESLDHSRNIDLALVNAQQARRILDRLVGYKLSPLLWTKIRYGLSAGRVQSIAVRIIVERELEREVFKPEEYWSVDALFSKLSNKDVNFRAELVKIAQKNLDIKNELDANSTKESLLDSKYNISKIEKGESGKYPFAPFTTSSLQQEANKKLGFTAKRTMMIAQKLYEGIGIRGDSTGLITYMRTDSTILSTSSVSKIRDHVQKVYGNNYIPSQPITYKNKSKSAQEAHEAIRPTTIDLTPESIKNSLTEEQFKIYNLIWRRAVASQMVPAKFETLTIEVRGKGPMESLFRVTGQKMVFDGFKKVYQFKHDKETYLNIDIKEGEELNIGDINPLQHFTQPPARYSEASLIKFLEQNGIGRPSTYAPIISTIQARGYVELENKYFRPTDTGRIVNTLLVKHFPQIVDLNFTSDMEDKLDQIADGKEHMEKILSTFYVPFETLVKEKNKEIKKEDIVVLGTSDEKCTECGEAMVIKLGKYGKFLSCSKFPECKGMKSLESEEDKKLEEIYIPFDKCDLCKNGKMVLKQGKFGKFWACTNYPKCKNIKPLVLKQACPTCGKNLVQMTGKFKKIFYGCSGYPDCKYHTNKIDTNSTSESEV